MGCAREELLSRYADRETTSGESAEIAAHLASCPACASAVEQFKEIASRLTPGDGPRRRSGVCPPTMLILDYLIGETDGETTNEIDEHLSRCDSCLHDLAVISPDPEAVITMDAGGEGAGERIRRANTHIDRLLREAGRRTQPAVHHPVFSWRARLLTAAASLLIGALATLTVLHYLPNAEAQKYTLTPRYTEGSTQKVKLEYIANGMVTHPDGLYSIPLVDEVSEEYDQTVLAAHNGIPSEVKRTYQNAAFQLFNHKTVTVTRTGDGGTSIASEDPRDFPILHPYAGPPLAAVEETVTFALPTHAVRVGDRWTANGQDLMQLIGKAMRHTLKGIRECSMTCALLEITPGKEAVIGLKLTYDAEHARDDLLYNTRGLFDGRMVFSIKEGRVLRVELKGTDIDVTATQSDSPESGLHGSTSISINIRYQ